MDGPVVSHTLHFFTAPPLVLFYTNLLLGTRGSMPALEGIGATSQVLILSHL